MHLAQWLLLANITTAFLFFAFHIAKIHVDKYFGIICILSFILYNVTMPSKFNIRVDLFITLPVTIIVLAMTIKKIKKEKK